MTREREIARRIAALFPSRFLRGYVSSKLSTDPVYPAVAQRVIAHPSPLLDLGCGLGLMEFYLRESGFEHPIIGIDHDCAKVSVAKELGDRYGDLDFQCLDLRKPLPLGRSVLLLDVLHYFTPDEQSHLLRSVVSTVPPGGVVIIRDAVRDGTWRYRLTYLQETFSRVSGWLRADRLSFPTRDEVESPFRESGFTVDVSPMWGRTPFNNYLFVFRRPSSGTTNS